MGSEGGAMCVTYWTVLYAKSSLDLSPGKEYIPIRNSYMTLENIKKKKNLVLQNCKSCSRSLLDQCKFYNTQKCKSDCYIMDKARAFKIEYIHQDVLK